MEDRAGAGGQGHGGKGPWSRARRWPRRWPDLAHYSIFLMPTRGRRLLEMTCAERNHLPATASKKRDSSCHRLRPTMHTVRPPASSLSVPATACYCLPHPVPVPCSLWYKSVTFICRQYLGLASWRPYPAAQGPLLLLLLLRWRSPHPAGKSREQERTVRGGEHAT